MKEGIWMKDLKDTMKNTKDQIEGKIKEVAGELTGNEQLELKGKLQRAKADIKKEIDVKDKVNEAKDKVNEVKEDIAKKINDALDKKE